MGARATLRLRPPSKKHLKVILKALEPEVRRPPTMRSQATLKAENDLLIIDVRANDTVALRAALNAYLRWISGIYSVFSTLELLSLSEEG